MPTDRTNLTISQIDGSYTYNLYLPAIISALGLFIVATGMAISACTLCQYVPPVNLVCGTRSFPCEPACAWLCCPSDQKKGTNSAKLNVKKRAVALEIVRDTIQGLGQVSTARDDDKGRSLVVKGGALQQHHMRVTDDYMSKDELAGALSSEDVAQSRMSMKRTNSEIGSIRESMRVED